MKENKLCECGCGEPVTKPGNRFIIGHNARRESKLKSQLCECGCGEYTKPGNRYINHHQRRGKKHTEVTKTKISVKKIQYFIDNPQAREANSTSHRKENLSELTIQRMSESHRKENLSCETIQKMSESASKRQFSEITRQKMSIANLGENNSMYGRKHLESTIQKMKLAARGRTGENNPNWQGGLSFGEYCSKFTLKFKEMIRDIYNRRCFLCGKVELDRKHDVHHVNYDKNCLCGSQCEFVPLCRSCHAKTNGKYNRKYWEDIIMNYLYPERYFMIDI